MKAVMTVVAVAVTVTAASAQAQEAMLFQADRTVLTPSRPVAEVGVAVSFGPEFSALSGVNLSAFIDQSLQFEVGAIPLHCFGIGGCPYEITPRGVERFSGAQLSSCLGFTPDPANPIVVLPLMVRAGGPGAGGGLLTTEVTRLSLYVLGDPCAVEIREAADAELFIGFTDCEADCDTDGELTFFDFLCFQELFVAGDGYADCNDDGAIDFFDFLCFQMDFAAGCP